jgi:hypothetical protein
MSRPSSEPVPTPSYNPYPIDVSAESGRNGAAIIPGSPDDLARKTAEMNAQSIMDTKYDVKTQAFYKEPFCNNTNKYEMYIILAFVVSLFILLVSRKNLRYKAKIYLLASTAILMGVVIYLYTRNGAN